MTTLVTSKIQNETRPVSYFCLDSESTRHVLHYYHVFDAFRTYRQASSVHFTHPERLSLVFYLLGPLITWLLLFFHLYIAIRPIDHPSYHPFTIQILFIRRVDPPWIHLISTTLLLSCAIYWSSRFSMADSQVSNSEDYSDESSGTGSEVSEDAPPPAIPAVIANWYLNENLGSGYSGKLSTVLSGLSNLSLS